MQRVKDDFEAAGLSVWTDEGIEPGTPSWKFAIEEAIVETECLVCVLSPDAKSSRWVRAELERAEMHEKPVFLILARGDERNAIPFGYEEAQRVDIRADGQYAVGVARLIGTIQKRLSMEKRTQIQVLKRSLAPGTELSTEFGPPQYGEEVIIRPIDSRFAKGSYTDQPEFQSFAGRWGWTVFYKGTSAYRSAVWTQWSPVLPRSGRYEVAAYVQGDHATTLRARYKVHGVVGEIAEIVVEIDQSRYFNQWVPLGIFEFDRGTVNAGAVFLNDLTYETDKEIAFDAMRWREVLSEG